MTTPIGKYRLVKLIAAGGMAEVYLARQAGAAGFEKLVCLKRILPHLARDRQFVEMFLNEARLAAKLDHPNIVSIFDLGEASGSYFIAMEFIDGPSLRAIAKRAQERGELLPIPELVKIVSMAAGGLHYAHELCAPGGKPLCLVHRDISPDNILVHRNGSAKVVDFGIAKAANSSSGTRTGTLKGKVAYMPPEQLRAEPLDRRADIFALGVVLYEMLSGRRPWEGESDVALIGQMMTQDPAPLAKLRPYLPEQLVVIAGKALQKDRAQRYQSCQQMQTELEALLVSMGQTITPARISDFVEAYGPESELPSQIPDVTGPELQKLEAEMNGTGSAPPLVRPRGEPRRREPRTRILPPPPEVPRRSAFAYGVAAFIGVAAAGGAGGYVYYSRMLVVPVERVSIAPPAAAPAEPPPVQAAAVPPPTPPPAAELPPDAGMAAAAPVAEAVKPPEPVLQPPTEEPPAQPPAPKRARRKMADPEEQPMAVVADPPRDEPPPPVVVANGELVLLIRPWAKVEIDGREIGVTPLDPISLSAGEHKVRLVNTQLGKDVTRVVQIGASEKQVLKELLDE